VLDVELDDLINIQHSSFNIPAIMNIKIISFITLLLVLTATVASLAQPGLPGTPDQAPIDGGLGILAALGGAYAVKKLRDRKK